MRWWGLVLLTVAGPLAAQDPISFADPRWAFQGKTAVDSGGAVLAIENGFAFRRDLRLQDGTIDVDVKLTRRRAFVYVVFRMTDDANYEELYLRPHKSGLPDAMQYAPAYAEQSAWQLYFGATGTAAPELPAGEWTRLRLVVSGRRAAVFLGDTVKPAMLIPRLGHAPAAGYIALRGFLPANTPGSGPIAWYKELRVRPGVIAYDFGPEPPSPVAAPGVITAWAVSPSFAAPDSAFDRIPAAGPLTRVEALPSGLLELDRVSPQPDFSGAPASRKETGSVARVTVTAPRAGDYRLDLGFSDAATVFVNGRRVFYKDDSYRFDLRRDGLIGFGQATVFLPLRAGANQLVVVITDHFGGRGIMGRFQANSGLAIEPR